ncbi:MAG TPA: U32 family peptidase, partial [Candidatus Mediterraneibacter ornithocaccae]|nr:U32 family peptidase [Candidatus Mediterraneibacter ornithocaccae]
AAGGENGEEISDLFHRIKEKKVEIISALPHIFRSSEYANMEHILNESECIHADGVLIRNLEEFQFLKKRGFDKKIILDHNLYVFNRYAKRFWNKLGVSEFTAPLELNSEELACLGLSDCELEIYGRAPVMVSAQCLFKTSGRCRRDYGLSGITDRCGSIYPVKAYCDSCYNVIHNDRPLCLAGEAPEIRLMNPRYLRIRFTTEAAGETAEVLKMMESAFCGTVKADQPEEEYLQSRYTEGHFRRGIL